MNIKGYIVAGLAAFSILSFSSCSKSIAAYHTFDVTCLGVELDGSQTLLSWGSGKNKEDAIEQATKNAVQAVLFKGILEGNKGCDVRPLINEPNAREKYEDYFNAFFADGGAYKQFATNEDLKRGSKDKFRGQYANTWSTIVRVLRSELKKKLQEDNILPK